jgi:hypothetical protein
MKLSIENTDYFVVVDGVPARVWEGVSEGGVAVTCLVTRVAVLETADTRQFELELLEQRPISAEGRRAFPRLVRL